MNPYNSHIFYDEFSYERNGELRDFVSSTFISALLQSISQQCILVLGGDGTMLRAISQHAEKEIPFVGINFGHKGFLLNHPHWIFPDIPKFVSRQYPLLELRNIGEFMGNAFNDIHLYSPEGKAISLEISNGEGLLKLWGDGAIIATPAGSTGHSKSYGGPVLPHTSKNIVITPKGNIGHSSPKAIEDSHILQIRNTGRKYPLGINIDGVQQHISQSDEDIELEVQISQKKVNLLLAGDHIRDWDNKVMQEQGFSI